MPEFSDQIPISQDDPFNLKTIIANLEYRLTESESIAKSLALDVVDREREIERLKQELAAERETHAKYRILVVEELREYEEKVREANQVIDDLWSGSITDSVAESYRAKYLALLEEK